MAFIYLHIRNILTYPSSQFLGLFDESMEKSDKSPITSKRISNIIDFLTYEVWRYQVRGLYEEHKFLYTLLLTLKISLQCNRIKPTEFMTFIKGRVSCCFFHPSSFYTNAVTVNRVY